VKSLRTVAAVLAAGLSLSACAGGLQTVKVGTVQTTYDQDGKVTSTIDDTAIGDPNSEYYAAVKEVARYAAEAQKAKAESIKDMMTPSEGEDPKAAGIMIAMGAVMIRDIDDKTSANIRAVVKAVTGYDIGMEGVKTFRELITVGIPWVSAAKMVGRLAERTGDSNQYSMGDNGNIQADHTEIHSENHNLTSTTGDNPTLTNNNGQVGGTEQVVPEEEPEEVTEEIPSEVPSE